MAKIQRGDIPRPLLEHLLLRVRERVIDEVAIQSLAAWLDTNPEVPRGSWFKRFPDRNKFCLNLLYQLIASIYFHRPARVEQRVRGLRLFTAIPPTTPHLHFHFHFHSPQSRQTRANFSQNNLDRALQLPHILVMKTAAVHSRIEPETKKMAEGILRKLGLSPTEAIRLFYTQITLRNGLPFNISIPNEETVQALDDSRKNRNLTTHATTDQLFASWNE